MGILEKDLWHYIRKDYFEQHPDGSIEAMQRDIELLDNIGLVVLLNNALVRLEEDTQKTSVELQKEGIF